MKNNENHNKKKLAIGVYDSGIGGLTVVNAIHKLLPDEDIIYFGDSVHLPYGNKSKSSILRYSIANSRFLMEQGVKIIVIACNTSAAIASHQLKKTLPLPVISVIEPGCQKAAEVTATRQIAIIGTYRTIQSLSYTKTLKKIIPNSKVYEVACPLFVPLIEENFSDTNITKQIINFYLQETIHKVDTLVLGCTHYPLLANTLKDMYDTVNIVDSAHTVAAAVKQCLEVNDLLAFNKGSKKDKIAIYTNDDNELFVRLVKQIFNEYKKKYVFKKLPFSVNINNIIMHKLIINFFILLSTVSLCFSVEAFAVVEEIYFVVEDNIITKLDFEREKNFVQKFGKEQLSPADFTNESKMDNTIISNMIVQILYVKKANSMGINITELDVTNYIKRIMAQNKIPNIETFKEAVEQSGINFKTYYKNQKHNMYIQQLLSILVRTQEPSNIEIDKYYNQHQAEYMVKTSNPFYRIQAILFAISQEAGFIEQKKTKTLALKVKKEIEEGKFTFSDAAAKYSDDLSNKYTDGLLNWFSLYELQNNLGLDKDILNTLQAQKTSGPIFTQRGFTLYYAGKIVREGNIPIEKAKVMIKNKLIVDQKIKALDKEVKIMFQEATLEKRVSGRFDTLKLPHRNFKN